MITPDDVDSLAGEQGIKLKTFPGKEGILFLMSPALTTLTIACTAFGATILAAEGVLFLIKQAGNGLTSLTVDPEQEATREPLKEILPFLLLG